MKFSRLSTNWKFSIAAILGVLTIGVVSGIGAFVGTQIAAKSNPEAAPLLLNAGTAARSGSVSMATGLIDENVEGLFILDHASGNLQCWLLAPRTGAVGGVYVASVSADLGAEKGGEADYVMTTGNFFFTGNQGGNQNPGNSICYVANTKTGKVVGYGLVYNNQAMRRGTPQKGNLKVVCQGTFRGEQVIRDQ